MRRVILGRAASISVRHEHWCTLLRVCSWYLMFLGFSTLRNYHGARNDMNASSGIQASPSVGAFACYTNTMGLLVGSGPCGP